MPKEITAIEGEPTRWLVRSSTRADYEFIVDSDYTDESGRRGWACGCERFMVTGRQCHHIDDVLTKIMSKTKFPRTQALAVAGELCRALKPACARLIVAGSLRRRKAEVGDVEILYIPRVEQRQDPQELLPKLVPVNLADEVLNGLLAAGVIAKRATKTGAEPWGPKNKLAVHVPSGIPVDLFTATEANWFNYLVCRTGSADNNLIICNAAIARGMKWNPYGEGFTFNGKTIPVTSEREAFTHVGLAYKEPWER